MTTPVWMADPPEVHSVLLSNGPGPGPLLAAAAQWGSLSAEYNSVADELSAALAAVQSGAWQGPSAESYVAANVPFLGWLMQASLDGAATAGRHQAAAAAYTSALATMPTLAELAANHAIHAVLVATNFFGINMIPISLNEADYARMWAQAATTMATYQTVSGAAVASTPYAAAAPHVVKVNGLRDDGDSGGDQGKDAEGVTRWSWWATRIEEVAKAVAGDLAHFSTDPAGAVTHLLTDPVLTTMVPHWAGEVVLGLAPQLTELSEVMLGLVFPAWSAGSVANVAPLAATGGLGGLGGLGGITQPAPAAAIPAPAAPAPGPAPLSAGSPAASPASAPPYTPTAPPTTVPTATSPLPATPPPVTGAEGFQYTYMVGGLSATSRAATQSNARAVNKASAPGTGAAATAAARQQAQRHQRLRNTQGDRGHRYEYPEYDADMEPDAVAASNTGAGPMGFAGTVHKDGEQARGLTALAGDSDEARPTAPMMPHSWNDPEDQQRQ